MTPIDHLIYAAAWLAFGLAHSLTAGATRRSGLGRLFGRGHRLAFNLLAIVELGAVLAVGQVVGRDARALVLPLPVTMLQFAMLGAGIVFGAMALQSYRPGPFVGIAQLRGEEEDHAQPLVVGGLHRWVRHPLYSALLLLVWGAARDELWLATAIWASLYLFWGSVIEERRLVTRYGQAYAAYRARVPRFVPAPWRERRQ